MITFHMWGAVNILAPCIVILERKVRKLLELAMISMNYVLNLIKYTFVLKG